MCCIIRTGISGAFACDAVCFAYYQRTSLCRTARTFPRFLCWQTRAPGLFVVEFFELLFKDQGREQCFRLCAPASFFVVEICSYVTAFGGRAQVWIPSLLIQDTRAHGVTLVRQENRTQGIHSSLLLTDRCVFRARGKNNEAQEETGVTSAADERRRSRRRRLLPRGEENLN